MTRADLTAKLRATAEARDDAVSDLLLEAAAALEAERRDAVAFLCGEVERYRRAIDVTARPDSTGAIERMSAKAAELRTMAFYFERGDHEGASS